MPRPHAQRHREIIAIVRREGRVRASELADRLAVSPVTIRRDVEHLAERGLVTRTHGHVSLAGTGAVKVSARRTIGLVLPSSSYYYDDIVAGARAAAADTGSRLILGVSDYTSDAEHLQAQRLAAKGIDGLIIAPTPEFGTGRLSLTQEEWIAALPVPTVLVERLARAGGPAAHIDSITSDHTTGAAEAVRHLTALGHRRLASVVIDGPNTTPIRTGLEQGAALSGVEDLIVLDEGSAGSADARDALLAAIAAGATGIFIHNDQLATRALFWLDEAGIAVPDEVSLICYDDVIAQFASIPLTALAPPKRAVGRRAVTRLLELCNADPDDADVRTCQRLSLVPRLVVRESTARAPR